MKRHRTAIYLIVACSMACAACAWLTRSAANSAYDVKILLMTKDDSWREVQLNEAAKRYVHNFVTKSTRHHDVGKELWPSGAIICDGVYYNWGPSEVYLDLPNGWTVVGDLFPDFQEDLVVPEDASGDEYLRIASAYLNKNAH